MHCDAFPSSLRTSLQPSALGLGARFAVTKGQPLDPAEGPSPSDSLRWLGNSTCGIVFEWVRSNLIKTWGTYFCTHPLRVKP